VADPPPLCPATTRPVPRSPWPQRTNDISVFTSFGAMGAPTNPQPRGTAMNPWGLPWPAFGQPLRIPTQGHPSTVSTIPTQGTPVLSFHPAVLHTHVTAAAVPPVAQVASTAPQGASALQVTAPIPFANPVAPVVAPGAAPAAQLPTITPVVQVPVTVPVYAPPIQAPPANPRFPWGLPTVPPLGPIPAPVPAPVLPAIMPAQQQVFTMDQVLALFQALQQQQPQPVYYPPPPAAPALVMHHKIALPERFTGKAECCRGFLAANKNYFAMNPMYDEQKVQFALQLLEEGTA
jgi:hypothetical protein